MFCVSCGGNWAKLAASAAKYAAARWRNLGGGQTHLFWAARAQVCERCHLRVIHRNISYCGKPYLHQPHRDDTQAGCGCPCIDKAKSPTEHCPLTARYPAPTVHHSAPTAHHAAPTVHHATLTVHHSAPTAHHAALTALLPSASCDCKWCVALALRQSA